MYELLLMLVILADIGVAYAEYGRSQDWRVFIRLGRSWLVDFRDGLSEEMGWNLSVVPTLPDLVP